jgi:hypothetical protein
MCNREGDNLQRFSCSQDRGVRVSIDASNSLTARASISRPTEIAEPNRHASGCVKGIEVDFMKKYLVPILLALGLVAFVPQKAKADGYFSISVET